MVLPRPEDLFAGPPRSPKEFVGRVGNILTAGEQVDLVDAVLADLSGAIPFVGDLFDVSRTAQLIAKPGIQHKEAKTALMILDAAVGLVPIVGDIVNLLIPANTINFLMDKGALPAPPELPPLPIPTPQELAARARSMMPRPRGY